MREPLLLPLAAFSAGIILTKFAKFGIAELALAALAVTPVLALALWRARRLAWLPGLVLLILAGIATSEWRRAGDPPQIDAEDNESLVVAGCIVEPPEAGPQQQRVVVELEPGARLRVNLFARPGERIPALHYGQMVEVEAKVRKPRNFANPGAFDFVKYLARRQVYWTGSATGTEKLHILPKPCGSPLLARIYAFRETLLRRIEQLYPGDAYASGVMQALLVGDASQMERMWTEDYRRTGTYHALVVSGLHVSVLAGALLFLFRLCLVPDGWRRLVCLLLAWFYAVLAGWQAPVIRAAGGFTLFLACGLFYRRARVLNVLAAVGLAFLAMDPEQIFEPSFQLSFLAVGAIGALAAPWLDGTVEPVSAGLRSIGLTRKDIALPPEIAQMRVELRLIGETLGLWSRLPERWWTEALAGAIRLLLWVWSALCISLCVGITMAIPMIFYFHRLSLTSISANLIVVPALNAAIVTGFLAVGTGWTWVAAFSRQMLLLAGATVEWHAQWEVAPRAPDPPVWLAFVFGIAIVLTAYLLRRRGTRLAAPSAAVCAVLLGVAALYRFPPETVRGALELTAIDVGQGDSLLVVMPGGETMLIDGGGIPAFGRSAPSSLDIGEDVVSPYLWRRGFRRLDVIASTHGHEDHIGGLPALIRNFRPRELWVGASPESAAARKMTAEARGIPVRSLRSGAAFQFGNTDVRVLAPAPDYVAAANPRNDDSLVLLLSFGNHRFLLTGDAERTTEEQLIREQSLQRIDVLKVAHHGSRTSTNPILLEAVRPSIGIVSVGAGNSYGLPHPVVIARLREQHVLVLRTDQAGLTTIRSDGRRLTMETGAYGLDSATLFSSGSTLR